MNPNEILPSNPSQLLTLMASTSTQIDVFSDGIIQAVKGGEINPLTVAVQLKAMEQATERIRKEIKPELMTEVGKYPEKKFTFLGNEITKAEHGSKFDYTVCNDPQWNKLNAQMEAIKLELDKRQEWLKTMATVETIVDKETGEAIDIFPPMKRSTYGINISIK